METLFLTIFDTAMSKLNCLFVAGGLLYNLIKMRFYNTLFFLFFLFVFSSCTLSEIDLLEDLVVIVPELEPESEPEPEPTPNQITPCVNGRAGSYPCSGFDLLARIPLNDFESQSGNDIWGWTDSLTNKEYALIGLNDGTAFVDISDPVNPVYLGKLPTATVNSSWRDIKVYEDHAFIVSEANNHGLQIFDLYKLRGLTAAQNFQADARLTSFGSAHNIAIDETSGYAYVIGSQEYSGGPLIIDISNPKTPVEVGGYSQERYSHDAQIVTYNGPDLDYVGKQIYIGSNEDKVVLLDVTYKDNIVKISQVTYSQPGYTHQGWFSQNFNYFFVGDELDEIQTGTNTRLLVFDFTDLDNPQLHHTYYSDLPAIDHNAYVQGNSLYLSNYTAGLRLIDISQIATKRMQEVAFFDSYPSSNQANFDGVWSIYPFFRSGVVVISDISSGLFLVKRSQ